MDASTFASKAGIIATAFAAFTMLSQPAAAVTTDQYLGEALLGNSSEDAEVGALAGILGVNANTLTFLSKNESPSLTVDGNQFILDVNPNEPQYFILKFGVGGPVDNSADTFFFRNIAELTLLVFENSQVNNLIKLDDLPDDTRLSHYTLVDGVSEIPLPASLPLFLAGLAGLGIVSRRRKGT